MTQIATVTALPAASGGQVEVTVARQSACSHNCESCGGCGGRTMELVVHAVSDIPLALGDRVEIYSGNKVLGAAALVYLGPVVLFLLGYLLTPSLAEGTRYLCAGLGFLLGLAGLPASFTKQHRCAPPLFKNNAGHGLVNKAVIIVLAIPHKAGMTAKYRHITQIVLHIALL